MASPEAMSSRASGLLIGVVIVAAAAGFGIYQWTRGAPLDQVPGVVEPKPEVPAPGMGPIGPTPAQAELPLPPVSTTAQPGFTSYPDGTWLPPLNGAKETVKHVFHRMLPFTKVVGRMRDAQGREWYVHENGVRSTTYVDATGRTLGLIEAPADVKPVLPEEGGK